MENFGKPGLEYPKPLAMFWRGRKDKKRGDGQSQANNGLATFLGEKIKKLQSGWAIWMHKRANKLKPGKLKILLLLFVTCFCSLSIKFFMDGLNNQYFQAHNAGNIKVPRINSPKVTEGRMDTAALRRIRKFRLYMDSLEKIKSNGKYDSILNQHPGLIDSLKKFEELYDPILLPK